MTTLEAKIQAARRACVPIIVITTQDPAETIRRTAKACQNGKEFAVLAHDLLQGLYGLNSAGETLAASLNASGAAMTQNPVEALGLLTNQLKEAPKAGSRAVIFQHLAHRLWSEPAYVQAVANLRDLLASIGATLVLLSTRAEVPVELRQDVIVMDDPLPSPDEIKAIVRSMAESAAKGGAEVNPEELAKDEALADQLAGLSGFGVRQVLAMAFAKTGLNRDTLAEHKRRLVEQTKGLSIWQGGLGFDDLAGLANLKRFLRGLLTSGKTPVRAIGFLDEIEKMLAGSGTDTSGVSQDQLQVFLRVMQDESIPGIILIGPPGTGKSAIAKATGSLASAPVIAFDLGAAKGSLVGESEERIRAMLSVFRAVSQGKGLFIATCNAIQALPPELRRRFKLGTFFVDLPDETERGALWELYRKRYGLTEPPPESQDWTGAEIEACCEVAWRTGLPLAEAASYIVPVAVSASESINALRRLAHNRFVSASKPGLYAMPGAGGQTVTGNRNLQFA